MLYGHSLGNEKQENSMERIKESYINQRIFLLKITRKIVKEESLAEDIVQDVYEKALSANMKERLNNMSEERLLAYLITMLKHRAYNVMRNRKRVVDFSALHLEFDFESLIYANMEDRTIDQLLFWQIKNEMKNLPKEDEIILKLCYIYEFTIKEIAYALDLKEGAVRKRLERARKKLEQLSEKYR